MKIIVFSLQAFQKCLLAISMLKYYFFNWKKKTVYYYTVQIILYWYRLNAISRISLRYYRDVARWLIWQRRLGIRDWKLNEWMENNGRKISVSKADLPCAQMYMAAVTEEGNNNWLSDMRACDHICERSRNVLNIFGASRRL